MIATTPRLLVIPLTALMPIEIEDANRFLVDVVKHRLGACERPFRQEAYAIEVDELMVSVAISASAVSDTILDENGTEFNRTQLVELARLGSAPHFSWASRVMIRLWREVCGPRYNPWTPKLAISYSQNAHHKGDLYRFDGWTKVRENAGSNGGGAWSRKRYAGDAHYGAKTLWLWRYP